MNRNITISSHVPIETAEQLEQIAGRQRLRISALIRHIIADWLRNQAQNLAEPGNPATGIPCQRLAPEPPASRPV